MSIDCIHESFAQRVVFATGSASEAIAAELAELGSRRTMLIATDRERTLTEAIASQVPIVHRHDEVVRHVPVDVAARARDAAAEARADALVSVGGGSSTGLAKAIALETGLPIIAVPTTYSGSEATNVWGTTEGMTKTTGVSARVLPHAVVYDATLLATLPSELALASGLNALAHGVDAMWGPRADPIDRAFAQEGIRSLAIGMRSLAADPDDLGGIEGTLLGAYLAAVAFASTGSGMHHKICHVLGGMFDLPHAQTHAVVLPYVLAFNGPAAPEAQDRIAAALGTDSASAGLTELTELLNTPRTLRELGMPETGIERAVAATLPAIPANNPRPVTAPDLTALLSAAWQGTPVDRVAGNSGRPRTRAHR